MKKLTRFAGVVFFLCLFTLSAVAQKSAMPTGEDRAAQLTQWMKSNLQLTEEQIPKVQDINLKYAKKVDELKTSTEGRRDKMESLKKDDEAKDAELKAVLNESQYQTYQAKKSELKKKFKEKMKEKKHKKA